MTSSDHVWEKLDGWDVCARCGVVHSSRYLALTPCRGALPLIVPRAGEQSPTSDEREIDRLRLEVARLRAAVESVAAELEAEAQAFRGARGRAIAVANWVRRRARDLRAVLDQGATR